MRHFELVGEIDVCVDCMFVHANGEYAGDPDDRPADAPDAWSLFGFGYSVTMGGEHAESCPNRDAVMRDVDCDCDDRGFSHYSCEGCGNHLAGDRYRFTAWRTTVESAHGFALKALASTRAERTRGNRTAMLASLARAGEWREYLSAIAASDRRFNLSMARMRAERVA